MASASLGALLVWMHTDIFTGGCYPKQDIEELMPNGLAGRPQDRVADCVAQRSGVSMQLCICLLLYEIPVACLRVD